MEWTDDHKGLMVSRHEAALIMDSVTVSHPLTRALALQVARLVPLGPADLTCYCRKTFR